MSEPEYWTPNLYPRQMEVFNAGLDDVASVLHPNFPTMLLVSGARETGKSIAVMHRICRHLFDTAGARVAMFSKTIKNLTDGGVFQDLTTFIMDEWRQADIGFDFTTKDSNGIPGPKTDSKTRTIYFRVSNRFGGESELKLFSLDHDFEVAQKLKETRFSLIWFVQLSNFFDPSILRCSVEALRMVHMHKWQHLFIADTNPSEEGEDSWIYKMWFNRRKEYLEKVSAGKTSSEFGKSLELVEFWIDDNLGLTSEAIAAKREMYSDDPGQQAREVDNKWIKGHGTQGKHFADVFVRKHHVIGGEEGEGDQIELSRNTEMLFTGWDLGSGTNHAAHILERRFVQVGSKELSVWSVIDELVSIRERMKIEEFTIAFHEIMKRLEERYHKKFEWVHYSDDSAVNAPRASGAGYDALEVALASKGEIELIGVPKPDGSVKNRVKIARRLLKNRRLFISSRCELTIKMFEDLKKGTTIREYVANNEDKHPFDSLTYPILMESADELLDELSKPRASDPTEAGLITVGGGPLL